MGMGDGHQGFFDSTGPGPFPEPLLRLLQEASLFYHVPYPYLVPDGQMIREDEIRFFKVDHNWVTALLDGICSLGRNASIDYAHDARWILEVYEKALRTSQEVREKLQGEVGQDREGASGGGLPVVTGFLLDSVVAEHYRGLEFKAFDQERGGARLEALRIEQLGRRMLLGLFSGRVRRLEICQPPEGLHYGCTVKSRRMVKRLRSLATGELSMDKAIDVSLKPGGTERILDIKETARSMKEALGTESVTSAEIAVEMIQNAQSAVFILQDGPLGRPKG